jgi:IPTL-CTERM motif
MKRKPVCCWLIFGVLGAGAEGQSRMFLVPKCAGPEAAGTTAGSDFRFETIGGQIITVEAYLQDQVSPMVGVNVTWTCSITGDIGGRPDVTYVTGSAAADGARPDWVMAGTPGSVALSTVGQCDPALPCVDNDGCPANSTCAVPNCTTNSPRSGALVLFEEVVFPGETRYLGDAEFEIPRGAGGTYVIRPECCLDDADCDNIPDGGCAETLTEIFGAATVPFTVDGLEIVIATADALPPTEELSCVGCGPGPGWVGAGCDQTGRLCDCVAGIDAFEARVEVGLDLDLDGQCEPDASLLMSGMAGVGRTCPLDTSGHFAGHGAVDQRFDVIDTEVISLSVTGSGSTLFAGVGLGQGGVLAPSLGTIVERASDSFLADGFFDVFLEIDLGGGLFAYNQTPVRLESAIGCVRPNATFRHSGGCIPLFSAPVGGVLVANLVTAEFGPPPPIPTVGEWGLTLMALLAITAGTVLFGRRRATTASAHWGLQHRCGDSALMNRMPLR